jgi:hypothetical protein
LAKLPREKPTPPPERIDRFEWTNLQVAKRCEAAVLLGIHDQFLRGAGRFYFGGLPDVGFFEMRGSAGRAQDVLQVKTVHHTYRARFLKGAEMIPVATTKMMTRPRMATNARDDILGNERLQVKV